MRLLIPLYAILIAVTLGCALEPRDRVDLATKGTPVRFRGLAPQAGQLELVARNKLTSQFEVFGTANTNGNTYTDMDGKIWYEYDKSITLPPDDKFWRLGCCTTWPPYFFELKTRMGGSDLLTFNATTSDTCLQQNHQTLGGAALGDKCASTIGDRKTSVLTVPSGGLGQACGDPNRILSNCQDGLVCGSDGNCKDDGWPTVADFSIETTHPYNAEFNWSNDVQGIASNGAHWYVSTTNRICRFSRRSLGDDCNAWDLNLRNDAKAFPAYIRGDLHISNMDVYSGNLYMGAFRSGDAEGSQVVTMVNSDLRNPTYHYLERGEAFLAIQRSTGNLYSITADDQSPRSLGVYQRSVVNGALRLTKIKTIPMVSRTGTPFFGNRFQGGKFSQSGKLYVVFDDDDASKGGIYDFTVSSMNARLITRLPVDYETHGYDCVVTQGHREHELEDILIEPIGASGGQYRGDIHLLKLNNNCSTDSISMRHYAMTPGKL